MQVSELIFKKAKEHFFLALNHILEENWIGAERELKISLQYVPNRVSTITNLCATLIKLKKVEEAGDLIEKALTLDPENSELLLNKGILFSEKKRYSDALASYERSIELKPDYAEAWNNRGVALNDLKRHDEALASYERSIELKPDYAEAIYNKALLQLTQRDFLQGFKNYLWRWQTKNFPDKPLQTFLPFCNSESIDDRVFLWAEQGLGDEIFYASMLSQANSIWPKITLSADKRLLSIFKRSFPRIEVIDRKSNNSARVEKDFTAQAPIGSLGYLLKLDSELIASSRKPFLLPDNEKTLQIKQNPPFASGKLVCGLAWKSSNANFGDAKSVSLWDFMPLFNNKNLSFVNLQYGNVNADIKQINNQLNTNLYQLKDLDLFNDIDGLLSTIDACDLVVTTSNVTAHLAGSIGKRGCVLVPFSKGRIWYWHLNNLYSFWYPSLRVFYQDHPNNWSSTINQMTLWLEENWT